MQIVHYKEKAQMRSIRLGRPFAAAATLLALAPAGASAAGTHPNLNGKHAGASGCRVSLFVDKPVITTGESVKVDGVLSCPGPASTAANQTVTLYEHEGGTPGFKVIGTATTPETGGVYSISVPLTLDSSFYASALGARSAIKRVKVAPQVTFEGPPESFQIFTGAGNGLHKRNKVTFIGKVTPASDEGAIVVLQRENSTGNEEWHAIQRGVVGPGGLYSIKHTFIVPGDANVRVIVRPRGKFSFRGESPSLSYVISQSQNPKLTINSSADPVAYQQPVTLTGVLEKGKKQPVTLEAHTHGNPGFTVVEKGMTDENGNYTFAVASALRSTFYRVSAPGVNSAVLYQGVKYALTAGFAPSSVQSGGSVTFSGTVAPAHVGHPVYLERQNVFGSGFHVVDVGQVSSLATYAITDGVVGSGNEVFRIRIPGDPENLAAFSSPFTVAVTPETVAALHPVTPGALPSEGQL